MKKVSIEFTITPKIELVLKASIDILICDINSNVMLFVIGNFEPSKNGKVKPAVLMQNISELINSFKENT